jgi:hypothetical protein
MEKVKGTIRIRDFQGMASNFDPTDIQPGVSQLQINVSGNQRGKLEVRQGLRELIFDTEDA